MAAYGQKMVIFKGKKISPTFSYAGILTLVLPTVCANFRKIKHENKKLANSRQKSKSISTNIIH